MKIEIINTIVKNELIPHKIVFSDTNKTSKSYGITEFHANEKYFNRNGTHMAMYFLFRDFFDYLPKNTYLVGNQIQFEMNRDGLFLVAYLFYYFIYEMEHTCKYASDPKNKMTVNQLNRRFNRKGMVLNALMNGIHKLHIKHSNIITDKELVYIATIQQYLNAKYQQDSDIKKVLALGYYIRVRSENIFKHIIKHLT